MGIFHSLMMASFCLSLLGWYLSWWWKTKSSEGSLIRRILAVGSAAVIIVLGASICSLAIDLSDQEKIWLQLILLCCALGLYFFSDLSRKVGPMFFGASTVIALQVFFLLKRFIRLDKLSDCKHSLINQRNFTEQALELCLEKSDFSTAKIVVVIIFLVLLPLLVYAITRDIFAKKQEE